MDVRLLKQFVAIYEEQSISKAAARTFVSQPALSNAIRHLEEELGSLLFNRSKRGVTPTREAEQLYPMATRVINELERIPERLKAQHKRQTISIAVMPELPHHYMGEFLRQIQDSLSGTQIILKHLGAPAEARIILDSMKREDELFFPLWREEYVFCVHKDHPLSTKEEISLGDLNQQAFVICPPCEAHQRTLGL
ncbi:LysR family transcriptional regulator [Endozoicomonas ascidiicola]|uniref:LysR family transcriptional regulator n=1 Tax=Endozoicomonas ascidiicola TaxID=1698521 RepID=UPI000A4EA9E1|nr:LysR family transcriptional regulator [Endozoicomonas ascidiicola]